LAGRIPTTSERQRFRESDSLNKRAELVRQLIHSPDFAFHLRNELDILLLRRLEHHDGWRSYLLEATQENRPWDQLFREILLPEDFADKRAARFLVKRIRDLDVLTNDCSVLWFGVNVGCAKCHDHPLVDDWKQSHYYGLASFFKRTFAARNGLPGERHDGRIKYKATSGEEFESDFMYLTGITVEEPALEWSDEQQKNFQQAVKKAEKDESAEPPTPDFRPRAELVKLALADQEGGFFARNIANRIWARLFGRGLVHPLDQMHSENPPSHPELLTLLAEDLRAHGYDLRRLIHAIALTDAYARQPASGDPPSPEWFAAAVPRPLTPHQLSLSLKIATANPDSTVGLTEPDAWAEQRSGLEKQSEAVARMLDIPEDGFQVPISESLWFSNNARVYDDFLSPSGNRLVGYLTQLDSDEQVILAACRSILSRNPRPEERARLLEYLNLKADRRGDAIGHVVWALLGSPEFRFNH
jgi:hypothetical protein